MLATKDPRAVYVLDFESKSGQLSTLSTALQHSEYSNFVASLTRRSLSGGANMAVVLVLMSVILFEFVCSVFPLPFSRGGIMR